MMTPRITKMKRTGKRKTHILDRHRLPLPLFVLEALPLGFGLFFTDPARNRINVRPISLNILASIASTTSGLPFNSEGISIAFIREFAPH